MKSMVLASALAAGVFAGAAVFLLLPPARGPASEDSESRTLLRDLRERIGDLTSEIDVLAQRIDAIERRAAASEPAAGGMMEGTAEAMADAAPPDEIGAGEEGSAALSRVPVTAAVPREVLSRGEPAEADALRQFVAQVIRQDREERQREVEEAARERMRRWKELREGPYGAYNFRVNSLAAKLGLTDAQKEYYHRILQEYEPRFRDLRKDVRWTDTESREAYQRNLEQLQQHLENTVRLGLNAEQREEYESLPPSERGVAGGAQVFASGGSLAADVLTVPLPAPDGDADSAVSVMEFSTSGEGGEVSSGTAVRILVGGPDAPLPPQTSETPSADSRKATVPTKPASSER